MTWAVTADPVRYDEAVDWFRKRIVLTADEASKLDARAQNDAFWIGGGLQLDQVQRVFDQMATAIEKGTPFEEFRKAVRGDLSDPVHTETVFRNAAQRAYAAGRYAQMTEPSVLKFRPFWLFDAVLDSRTTTVCRPRDGTLLPAEDPWWTSNIPPLHHRCRSSIRNIRKSEADLRGGTKRPPPGNPPDGWGQLPTEKNAPKPDPKKKDPALVKALEAKKPKTPPRKPKPPAAHTPDFWEAQYSKQYGVAAKAVAWGRAAQERGLDMPLPALRKQLERVKHLDHVRHAIDRIDEFEILHGGKTTLRERGGELQESLRVAATIGGHLDLVGKRTPVSVPDLLREERGRAALRFFSEMTSEAVTHPTSYAFEKIGRNARAFHSATDRKIAWNDGPGVLEHEWAHGLERLNPRLADRAQAFLKARTSGETAKRLDKLRPRAGYKPHEIAKEDNFIEPYIGRIYESQATEITSMGTELLAAGRTGWGNLEALSQKDSDLLFFTLGQLAHP